MAIELPPGWVDPPPLTEEEMRRMDAEGLTLSDALRMLEAEFGTGDDEGEPDAVWDGERWVRTDSDGSKR